MPRRMHTIAHQCRFHEAYPSESNPGCAGQFISHRSESLWCPSCSAKVAQFRFRNFFGFPLPGDTNHPLNNKIKPSRPNYLRLQRIRSVPKFVRAVERVVASW